MWFNRKNKLHGFTLIELLVVISIISLLASIVLSSVNVAREKARDAKRLADFDQIEIALALYYEDNDAYPPGGTGGWSDIDGCDPFPGYTDLYTFIAPYIASPVIDPLPGYCNWYQMRNSGNGYVLAFETEQSSLGQKSPLGPEDFASGSWYYDACRDGLGGFGTWYCTGINY